MKGSYFVVFEGGTPEMVKRKEKMFENVDVE